MGKNLIHYSIDRLESEYYCHRTIGFWGKNLIHYSIDRLESEHCGGGETGGTFNDEPHNMAK